jgi:hypothetical protein
MALLGLRALGLQQRGVVDAVVVLSAHGNIDLAPGLGLAKALAGVGVDEDAVLAAVDVQREVADGLVGDDVEGVSDPRAILVDPAEQVDVDQARSRTRARDWLDCFKAGAASVAEGVTAEAALAVVMNLVGLRVSARR